jgi:hypothetical protein
MDDALKGWTNHEKHPSGGNPPGCWCGFLPYIDLCDIAPEADALVILAEDPTVAPFPTGSWEWLSVGVAGAGVDGEHGEGATAAIHLDF